MADRPGSFEGEGGTVEEAILVACGAAGIDPSVAMIQVLSEGGAAVPGERISGSRARVRVEETPPEARRGKAHLERILELMEIDAHVWVQRPASTVAGSELREDRSPVLLEVEGVDLGILIGWRGESLRALQTVVNLMLGEVGIAPGAPRLIVDIARYRQRREQAVASLAQRMAAGVARSGRAVTLEPMPPYERRAVHLALADDASVVTESTGADVERRVTIRPAGEAGL